MNEEPDEPTKSPPTSPSKPGTEDGNKGPKPNHGQGPKHGGHQHNGAIDDLISDLLSDPEVTDVRKNQAQVNIHGNKVGNNRPETLAMSRSQNSEIDQLLDNLDGSGSDSELRSAIRLREVLGERLPAYLLERYKSTSTWGARASLVYRAQYFARQSDESIELGLLAARDKSKVVRYEAFMLLAISLRKSLLPKLRKILSDIPESSREDALAAIDAIEHQNRNYFVDRSHSGKITLTIC